MTPNSNCLLPYHGRFCALRHRTQALYFLLPCLALAVVSWRSLDRPFATQGLFTLVFGHVTALMFLTYLMLLLKCFRERLVISLAMIQSLVGLLRGLFPGFTALSTSFTGWVCFLLWVLACVVSLSMLLSTLRSDGA